MRRKLISKLAATAGALACGACAMAAEPFQIIAQTTSGTPQTISVSGSSLPDLVSHLVKSQSDFSSLSDRDITASVRYGGVNNAIFISRNAANTSATVSIPSIGFTKTFTGTSARNLEHQISDYVKKSGADIYGDFLRSINKSTDIGVTDGNPLATTAILANQAYQQFGLLSTPWAAPINSASPLDEVATPNIRLDFNGGYSHSDTSSSYYTGGAFSSGIKFGDRFGLVFTTPFEYRNVEGADVYNVGEEISLPVLIFPPSGGSGVYWMLTPTAIGGLAGSVDLAAGGTFAGGAITSSAGIRLDSWIFTFADSFSYFHGFPIRIGEYHFNTNLDQEVLKNGVQVTKFFGNSLFLDAGITYTNFLQDAAVKEYLSPSAGLGLRINSNFGMRVGYAGDFHKDFIAHGGELQFYFNY